MNKILEIKNITKQYKDFTLDHVSFDLPEGSIMGFIGENGAGKTTTIKAILNLIHIDEGSINVFGKDMAIYEKENKENIGVVLSESMFPENMSIIHINKVLMRIYKNWDSSKFFAFTKQFQLPEDKRIKEFSKGMKMKLAIACAMSHHAKLLILDEATAGLDPIVRDEILDVFMDFIQNEKHSILLSSHIISDIEKVADYVTFIHQGKIVLSNAKDELLDRYGVLKTTPQTLELLDKRDYIGYRKSSFSLHVLIVDRHDIKKRFPNEVVDPATLEDIMLFSVKGDC